MQDRIGATYSDRDALAQVITHCRVPRQLAAAVVLLLPEVPRAGGSLKAGSSGSAQAAAGCPAVVVALRAAAGMLLLPALLAAGRAPAWAAAEAPPLKPSAHSQYLAQPAAYQQQRSVKIPLGGPVGGLELQ